MSPQKRNPKQHLLKVVWFLANSKLRLRMPTQTWPSMVKPKHMNLKLQMETKCNSKISKTRTSMMKLRKLQMYTNSQEKIGISERQTIKLITLKQSQHKKLQMKKTIDTMNRKSSKSSTTRDSKTKTSRTSSPAIWITRFCQSVLNIRWPSNSSRPMNISKASMLSFSATLTSRRTRSIPTSIKWYSKQ